MSKEQTFYHNKNDSVYHDKNEQGLLLIAIYIPPPPDISSRDDL